jgi:hypothetical protein
MEGYDSLMMRTMFEIVPPNRELSMKEAYHEKVCEWSESRNSRVVSYCRIIPEPRFGVVFKGPKTKIIFLGVREADILIFDLDDDGWNVMPRRRHAEIEKKVMNILRKLYRKSRCTKCSTISCNPGIPGGPVGEISGYLTGYKGKNAEQQGDIAAEEAGIQSAFPNRKKFSGRRKTLRRKNLRSSRKNK